ncbi:MAG TPA: hypothetical protein VEB19_03435 [Gemmatimonadaceae bacterium]|nr:hypothetical protein [Gemmatimonadaceae bacterium]
MTPSVRVAFMLVLLLPSIGRSQRAQSPPPEQRAQLEAQLRREYTRVVRQRVGLSEDQMAKLEPINQRFANARRTLQLQERDTRVSIQRALRDSAATRDSAALSGLLQRLVDVQKRRVQLVEDEQRELAAIMSPLQRARYMAVQEQMRRRVDQRRSRGTGAPPQGRRSPA